MIGEISPERAAVILSALDKIETLSAFVKAEMNTSRGSVGTTPGKLKKNKAEQIKEEARKAFHKRK